MELKTFTNQLAFLFIKWPVNIFVSLHYATFILFVSTIICVMFMDSYR